MKKICVNGKFFSQQITGTQRYARELLHQFDQLLAREEYRQIEVEVLVPPSVESIPRYINLQVRSVGTMRGTKWEQLELPWFCRDHILLTLSGGAPLLHSRNVVTIHDAAVAAVPAGYSRTYRLWHRNACRRMARTAQHVFTNSNFSKSELVRWYGADPRKITVTYLGSDHFFGLEADSSTLTRLGISGKYVLTVSSHNPNKNFNRVVQAMRQLDKTDLHLVIAGGYDTNVYRSNEKLPNGALILGYVSDSDLKALYQNAECFVFASLYEGFGLPPLEAMAAGCPVVVSRAGALPEIFEGAAVFCDPYRPEDIAASIQHAVMSPSATNNMKRFAEMFRWEKCARQTLEVIASL